MKKLFTIVLVLVLSMMVVGSAFAERWSADSVEITHFEVGCGEQVIRISGIASYRDSNRKLIAFLQPGAIDIFESTSEPGTWAANTPLLSPGTYKVVAQIWGLEADLEFHYKVRDQFSFTIDACYQVCDRRIVDEIIVDEGPWSEEVWDAGLQKYVSTRTVVTTTTYVDAQDGETPCPPPDMTKETEERTRGPDEVIVGASFGCSSPDEDGIVYQLQGGVTVDPSGGATLTLDGVDYTASQGMHLGFGSYTWSAIAAESFTILGDSSGTVRMDRDDCNPEDGEEPREHPETGSDMVMALPVVAGLAGLTLLAVGAKLVFKREE